MMKDTQNFKGMDAREGIRPMNRPMPMSNPVGLKTAMNNTFSGMPAYPNQYVFEGMGNTPLRPGEMRNVKGDDCP